MKGGSAWASEREPEAAFSFRLLPPPLSVMDEIVTWKKQFPPQAASGQGILSQQQNDNGTRGKMKHYLNYFLKGRLEERKGTAQHRAEGQALLY